MSKKRRAQMLRKVKEDMRARGELTPVDWTSPAPSGARQARLQAMRTAFEEEHGDPATRRFESSETFDDRMDRAYDSWRKKHEIKRAKRRMVKREKRALRGKQMAAGADHRGILYTGVDEGMLCRILPRETVDDHGNIKVLSPGNLSSDPEVHGLKPGDVVTALFEDRRHMEGNRYVNCMLPDGRHLPISKVRLEPMDAWTLDGDEEDEDLFAPEDDDSDEPEMSCKSVTDVVE